MVKMQSETGFLENQDGGWGIGDQGSRIDDKLKENQHTEIMTVI